ncbi:MAG: translation initiation factor IF-2 [Opitutales bacterium]
MSVRIYELSKDLGMENAELIGLLRERGYQVKSASSTVDNISAESLREEFVPKAEAAAEVEKPAEAAPAEAPKETVAPQAPKLPAGALVRSKEDVARERAAREEEEARQRAASPPPTPPRPTGPGKAPPPLPGGPAVTIRRPPPPLPAVNVPPRAPNLPGRGPVLRTDVKKEEPPPAPKTPSPSRPEPRAPAQPPRTGPAPVSPPRVSAPRPMAPPPVSRPPQPPVRPSAPLPPREPSDEETPEAAAAEPATEAPAAPALVPLQVKSPIVVRDFAIVIGKKPFQLISDLMELGIFASMNTAIEEPIAEQIAKRSGFALEVRHRGEAGGAPVKEAVAPVDESAFLEPRPPVVCILGHVDHGKTTLLDTIRKASVAKGEAGGITQHIGAYQVEHNEKQITFIDTPGHAAFSSMRARGAGMTDIAILVVAADDGFMPQTDEALEHIRRAKVPVVVAINKMDAPGANVEKVLRQMQERDLSPEEWGGETLSAQVSALKGEKIEDLLDAILLQAEIMDSLVANPKAKAEGVVIEAQKELGRGSTASVIIQRGTLKPGDALVCGEHYCRVRQILNDQGKPIKSAGPATPVKIVGWSGPPDAGDIFQWRKNERVAKREAEENELDRRRLEESSRRPSEGATIEDLFAAIAKTQKKSFRVIVKADVYGTAEALATSLLNIKSDKIDLEVVDTGVGSVTKNDCMMADAGHASIIAFNVGLENGVGAMAKHNDVKIFKGDIIYQVIDEIKEAMAEELEPELRESKVGAAEVRAVFPLGKNFVAGCMVTEGKVTRGAKAIIYRDREVVVESRVKTLRRFKDDANEVRAGYECGIAVADFNGYEEGDIIEVFAVEKIKPSL